MTKRPPARDQEVTDLRLSPLVQPPSTSEDASHWLIRGREILTQFEEQARTHQELADSYRAQAARLHVLLTGNQRPLL